jgi:hypothetical protein
MGSKNEGRALAALLALWAIAACGGSGAAGSKSELDGGSESTAPSDASAMTLPSATAFADVNIEADFTQPVELPPPVTTIAGDSASIVGSWVELSRDGSVCTPATGPYIGSCFHLDIQKDDAGAVEGTIHEDTPYTGMGTPPAVIGPFPPATDPSIGYPPSVSPNDYIAAEQLSPNIDYRILDGVVDSGSFTFWFSPLDLWSTWCALQTPYAWNVGGVTKYRCVPQTVTVADTDVGKFDLCTSSFGGDNPQCTDINGFVTPCACLSGDGGILNESLPGCVAGTVCECSAMQCRANLRAGEIDATLTLGGGKLVGSIQIGPLGFGPPLLSFSFQRATQ